jgi:hydrogenase small subunit
MSGVEFTARQNQTEQRTVHVLWMTSGLGCDGDTVSMTAATSPSLEDLLGRTIPGMPGVVIYNPFLAVEYGDEFMKAWYDAEAGKLDPFILMLEGAVPNEDINGDGHWSGFGVDPVTKQPITTNEWIDRLAPHAAIVMAVGTCATYGGVPAMKNNPTGAMGLRDYLGRSWTSRLGHPIVNLPGCPAQPDNITETLLYLVLQIAGTTRPIELDEQGRPAWLFERTAHEVCNRAGFADHGDYADQLGDDGRCLVKFGCKGPVVKCNVPARGWINGIGGCPNVGGICMACTMPGFPDKYMPLMDTGVKGKVVAAASRFAYGPLMKQLRNQTIKRRYDVEPAWRQPGDELKTGYKPRW